MYTSPIWNLYDDGITQSMIASWLSCPEKFKLSAIDALKPREARGRALHFGSVFHELKDIVYTQFMTSGRNDVDQFIAGIEDIVLAECSRLYDIDLEEYKKNPSDIEIFNDMNWVYATVEVIAIEYFKYYADIDFRQKEWVSLEEEFDFEHKLKSGKSIRRRGKIDGVFKDQGYWVMENKTKGSIEIDGLVDTINMNLQTNYYLDAVEEKYGSIAGMIYNLIKRPRSNKKVSQTWDQYKNELKLKIQSDPKDYFARISISLARADRAEWKRDIDEILNKIEQWFLGEFHYRNPLSCISQYGKPCPYRRICSYNDKTGFSPRETMFNELESTEE